MPERRQEPDLEVLWQRHLPEGYAASMPDERARALAKLGREISARLRLVNTELDRGDLVVTIARRPALADTVRSTATALTTRVPWAAPSGPWERVR